MVTTDIIVQPKQTAMNIGSYQNPYTAAEAAPSDRAMFIRNTYLHVALATLGLIAFEAVFTQTEFARELGMKMLSGQIPWLLVLGLYMVVSFVANRWAASETSRTMQYVGLGLYTVAFGVLVAPMLIFLQATGKADIIAKAGLVTGGLFLGLTAVVFMTKKDFSFLGSILSVGFFVALGFIVAGIIFKFDLGLFFSFAMVLLLGGSILYTTSNIIHHYHTKQHVAASLALFSSIATMFWYVLQIFMSSE